MRLRTVRVTVAIAGFGLCCRRLFGTVVSLGVYYAMAECWGYIRFLGILYHVGLLGLDCVFYCGGTDTA